VLTVALWPQGLISFGAAPRGAQFAIIRLWQCLPGSLVLHGLDPRPAGNPKRFSAEIAIPAETRYHITQCISHIHKGYRIMGARKSAAALRAIKMVTERGMSSHAAAIACNISPSTISRHIAKAKKDRISEEKDAIQNNDLPAVS
jgi:hypothetical protein